MRIIVKLFSAQFVPTHSIIYLFFIGWKMRKTMTNKDTRTMRREYISPVAVFLCRRKKYVCYSHLRLFIPNHTGISLFRTQ